MSRGAAPRAAASRRKKAKAPAESPAERLPQFYDALFAAWGKQKWWPGDSPFEVIVGAILTQNTNWTNVEKAIANLKAAGMLDPQALHYAPHERIAERIRPSGYFNVKAKRLKSFLDFFFCEAGGSIARLNALPTRELRGKLLAVHGLGPETVDSILLYALNRPVFVVDAYTRRILKRHLLIEGGEDYETIRGLFETHVARSRKLFNEYHALIVRAGKAHCKPAAKCDGCPLAPFPKDEKAAP